MPFSLTGALVVFQHLINRVLGSLRFTTALAYLDHIPVPSINLETGFAALKQVLDRLRKAKLTLRLSKCFFFHTQITYLGHEISADGVKPSSTKMNAIRDFPRPKRIHHVRQYLGLTSYFRKFIKNYAIIASPLTNLLKKDVNFVWDDKTEQAFIYLKTVLYERPILSHFDKDAPAELHTDASKLGVADILF